MSRFHGIRDYGTISAHELVSFAFRLAHYDGCFAHAVRQRAEDEQDELETRGNAIAQKAVAFDGSREALEANQLFAGLGSYSTAPAI